MSTTNASDRFDTFNEVAADQIKAFRKSLHGLPLQERRMSTFGFEAFSLPASRVRAPSPLLVSFLFSSAFTSRACALHLNVFVCLPLFLSAPPLHLLYPLLVFSSLILTTSESPLALRQCQHWSASILSYGCLHVSHKQRAQCLHARPISSRLRASEAQQPDDDARHHGLCFCSQPSRAS